MAETYEIEVQAQPGIYKPTERSIKIYFAEPDKGVDKNTGILMFAAGYGGHAMSNVFQKMRREFADKYNLLTVQCDYFGYEYMQDAHAAETTAEELKRCLNPAEFELLQMDYDKYAHILKGKRFHQDIILDETPEYFNDMGLMQAADMLRSMKVVLDIAAQNGCHLDETRVYGYGFSHGAYLMYLCNALWPGLFTGIIDNSSYLTPYYLARPRQLIITEDGVTVEQAMNYKALEFVKDEDIFSLPYLYRQFENEAQIVCFAGETDWMTSLEDKKAFLNDIKNVKVETITKSRIDRIRFKNTDHGLGADFLELFHYANQVYLIPAEKQEKKKRKADRHVITCEDVSYETSAFKYDVRWEDGMPILYRTPR